MEMYRLHKHACMSLFVQVLCAANSSFIPLTFAFIVPAPPSGLLLGTQSLERELWAAAEALQAHAAKAEGGVALVFIRHFRQHISQSLVGKKIKMFLSWNRQFKALTSMIFSQLYKAVTLQGCILVTFVVNPNS